MMPHELQQEQASPTYGGYQEVQQEVRPYSAIPLEQPMREGPEEKVYPEPRDNKNMLRLLWFGVSMVALLAFAIVCLVIVGGTPGWISFVAAALTIMVIAGTAISTIK